MTNDLLIGNNLTNIPHIKIGLRDENSKVEKVFNPKEEDLFNKVKKWGLIIIVLIVICYAVWRIISGW